MLYYFSELACFLESYNCSDRVNIFLLNHEGKINLEICNNIQNKSYIYLTIKRNDYDNNQRFRPEKDTEINGC
jgi:hypothetical protein